MKAAFLPPAAAIFPRAHSNRLPTCKRRVPCRTRPSYNPPSMMAKYQQQESGQEVPDGESALEDIIPKPVLPTLTTLSGQPNNIIIPLSEQEQAELDNSKLSMMGASLSAEDEESIKGFFLGVVAEFKLVEWPSAGRVARLTVLIIATIIIAVVALYFVDGFFYRLAGVLFEGKPW